MKHISRETTKTPGGNFPPVFLCPVQRAGFYYRIFSQPPHSQGDSVTSGVDGVMTSVAVGPGCVASGGRGRAVLAGSGEPSGMGGVEWVLIRRSLIKKLLMPRQ